MNRKRLKDWLTLLALPKGVLMLIVSLALAREESIWCIPFMLGGAVLIIIFFQCNKRG